MKKIVVCIILIFFKNLTVQAQGIKFEENLNWTQIKEKAKAEGKYIFVDCYATWCGPCRIMDAEVYPEKEVGDYFNQHFVSVKIQMDRTRSDSDITKGWYADAKELEQKYNINAYPSFLFFNPDGQAVHHVVGGQSPKRLVDKAKEALIPEKQYFTLMEQWDANPTDSAVSLRSFYAARTVGDKARMTNIADAYIGSLRDPFKKENLQIISTTINSSNDRAFSFFMDNSKKIDSIMGTPGLTQGRLSNIIYNESIRPKLLENSTSWTVIKTGLLKQYPKLDIWKKSKADTAFLTYIYDLARRNNDYTNEKLIGIAYLKLQKNLFTIFNIRMMESVVTSTSDKYFHIMLGGRKKIDSIMGRNHAEDKLTKIVFQSELIPLFTKTDDPVFYEKQLKTFQRQYPVLDSKLDSLYCLEFKRNVDFFAIRKLRIKYKDNWDFINRELAQKLPGYDFNEALLPQKAQYYSDKQNWVDCESVIYGFLLQYGKKLIAYNDPGSDYQLNDYLWDYIFLHGKREIVLEEGIKYAKILAERKRPQIEAIDTYANLLYKAGRKKEAINEEIRGIDMLESWLKANPNDRVVLRNIETFNTTLKKMQNDEKIGDQ